MDAVVFNPTNYTVQTSIGAFESGKWRYVAEVNALSAQLASGCLIIAHAPEDPMQINPNARASFEELRNNRNKNVRNAKTASVRDTEVSEAKNDSKKEA